MINKTEYVDLGLACAEVCGTLGRGTNGRNMDRFNQSVLKAVEQLTM